MRTRLLATGAAPLENLERRGLPSLAHLTQKSVKQLGSLEDQRLPCEREHPFSGNPSVTVFEPYVVIDDPQIPLPNPQRIPGRLHL